MATRNSTTRQNFTAGRVAAFECPPEKQQAYYWDAGQPGLGIRATARARSYIFQRKIAGKQVRVTIGDCASWGIDQARAEAKRLSILIDQGIDPRQEKADRLHALDLSRQEKERATATLGHLWGDYVAARSDDWSEAHRRDHEQAMTAPGRQIDRKRSTKGGPLYPLRDIRLEELTADRLQDWLESERKTRPAYAARAFRLLRACLRWAEGRPEYAGLADPGRVLTGDVRRKVPKLGARDDCLQREQLALWFEAVRTLPDPTKAAYLQGLLITGARRQELAWLRWDDVEFQWGALTIRDKVEGERVIPLTPYLATLLDALPRRNEWVFSSPTIKSGRMGEANQAHTKALRAAGLPHVTLHGLRRSFGTLSEWVECPVGVVAQIQGHKPSAIAEKHYRRRPLDLLRKWHTKIEAWILDEAGIPQPEPGAGRLRVAK